MKTIRRLAIVFLAAALWATAAVGAVFASAAGETLSDVSAEFTDTVGSRPESITFESDTFLKTDGLILRERMQGKYTIEFDAATTADGSAALGGGPIMITFGNASATEGIGGDAQINKDDSITFIITVGGIDSGRSVAYTASGHRIWNDTDCTQTGTGTNILNNVGAYFSGNQFFRFRLEVTAEGTIDIYASMLNTGLEPVYLNTVGAAEGDTTTATTDGYFSLLSGTTGELAVKNFKVNGEPVSFEGEDADLIIFGEQHTFSTVNQFVDNSRMTSEFYVDDTAAAAGDVLFDVTYDFRVVGTHGPAPFGDGTHSVALMFGMPERDSLREEASIVKTGNATLIRAEEKGASVGEEEPSSGYIVNGLGANMRLVGKKGGTLEVYAVYGASGTLPETPTKTYTGLTFNGYMAFDVADATAHGDTNFTELISFSVKVNENAITYVPYGVEYTEDAISVAIGATVTPVCSVVPAKAEDQTLSYTSSDPEIATVNASTGEITGVAFGETVITAKSVNGFTDTITVNVIQPATSISLSDESVSLDPGQTHQLTATVLPENAYNKEVTFTSSDTTVVQVNNEGLITAVGGGSAEITVATTDGSVTAVCTVLVRQPVNGVTLDVIYVELSVGDNITLTATVNPAAATERGVSFSSSDASIVSVTENGEITALKEGTATITVTSAEGGYTDECVVVVSAPQTQEGGGCSGTAAPAAAFAGAGIIALAAVVALICKKRTDVR